MQVQAKQHAAAATHLSNISERATIMAAQFVDEVKDRQRQRQQQRQRIGREFSQRRDACCDGDSDSNYIRQSVTNSLMLRAAIFLFFLSFFLMQPWQHVAGRQLTGNLLPA